MRSGCREGPQSCPMPVVPWASEMTGQPFCGAGPAGTKNAPETWRLPPSTPDTDVYTPRHALPSTEASSSGGSYGSWCTTWPRLAQTSAATSGNGTTMGAADGAAGSRGPHVVDADRGSNSKSRTASAGRQDSVANRTGAAHTPRPPPRSEERCISPPSTNRWDAEDSRHSLSWTGRSAACAPRQRHQRELHILRRTVGSPG